MSQPPAITAHLAKPTGGGNCRHRVRGAALDSHDLVGKRHLRPQHGVAAIRCLEAQPDSLESESRAVCRDSFLGVIGVVRESLGDVEDRLFSTVFLGSGLLFLAMLFVGAVSSASLVEMLDGSNANADVYAFGRDNAQTLLSVYGMRMAAVFTCQSAPWRDGLRPSSAGSRTWDTSLRWSCC